LGFQWPVGSSGGLSAAELKLVTSWLLLGRHLAVAGHCCDGLTTGFLIFLNPGFNWISI
jgi:hypothetical protein